MAETVIKRGSTGNGVVGAFIHEGFTQYGIQNEVSLNFSEFCFVAENRDGNMIGAISGRAYYNEVHIGDLIIDEKYRRCGLGSRLVRTVEDAYQGKGYDIITLSTFGFQAPEFYKKLGYELEFVREDRDPKLSKYFYLKKI